MKKLILLMLAVSLSTGAMAAQKAVFTPAETKAIEKTVHDYLVNNPEILVEVSKALQDKEKSLRDAHAQKAIKAFADELFNQAASPVVGNPKGNVVLVEFFDYQCSHCKRMTPIVKQAIDSNKDLRVVYKEFPIFGANSQFAAKAALASQKQGKYEPFHEALMNAKTRLNEESVLKIAEKVGINTKQLKADMKSSVVENELQNNLKLAEALGVMGTPAFVVGTQKSADNGVKAFFIPGATSYEGLQAKIKQVR